MDWRNEEADYSSVENFLWDERNILTKNKSAVSLSGLFGCSVCSQGVQTSFCKESRSFTSAFERLELEAEAEVDPKNDAIPVRRTSVAQTDSSEDMERELNSVKPRDISFQHVLHDHDILNYQGRRYSPEDIARYWKKDSRMWLWKSARRNRRKQNMRLPDDTYEINKEEEET